MKKVTNFKSRNMNESIDEEVYADIVNRLGNRKDKTVTKAEIAKMLADGELETIQPEYIEKKLKANGWDVSESEKEKAQYAGKDDWSRKLYKTKSGKMYVDIDDNGVLYSMTDQGEPLAPASNVEVMNESAGEPKPQYSGTLVSSDNKSLKCPLETEIMVTEFGTNNEWLSFLVKAGNGVYVGADNAKFKNIKKLDNSTPDADASKMNESATDAQISAWWDSLSTKDRSAAVIRYTTININASLEYDRLSPIDKMYVGDLYGKVNPSIENLDESADEPMFTADEIKALTGAGFEEASPKMYTKEMLSLTKTKDGKVSISTGDSGDVPKIMDSVKEALKSVGINESAESPINGLKSGDMVVVKQSGDKQVAVFNSLNGDGKLAQVSFDRLHYEWVKVSDMSPATTSDYPLISMFNKNFPDKNFIKSGINESADDVITKDKWDDGMGDVGKRKVLAKIGANENLSCKDWANLPKEIKDKLSAKMDESASEGAKTVRIYRTPEGYNAGGYPEPRLSDAIKKFNLDITEEELRKKLDPTAIGTGFDIPVKSNTSESEQSPIADWWNGLDESGKKDLIKKYGLKEVKQTDDYSGLSEHGKLEVDNIFSDVLSVDEAALPARSPASGWWDSKNPEERKEVITSGNLQFATSRDNYLNQIPRAQGEIETAHTSHKASLEAKPLNEDFGTRVAVNDFEKAVTLRLKLRMALWMAYDIPNDKASKIESMLGDLMLDRKTFKIENGPVIEEISEMINQKPEAIISTLEQELSKWPKDTFESQRINERKFTQEERDKLAKSGDAMSDGSFPIENEEDLKNAIRSVGRAKDSKAAKKHIIKRAKALSKSDLLPEDWGSDINEDRKMAKITSDGNDWYLAELDKTHVAATSKDGGKGEPYHIGQLKDKPFYSDVEKWLSDPGYDINGKKYGKTNEEEMVKPKATNKFTDKESNLSNNEFLDFLMEYGIEPNDVSYPSDDTLYLPAKYITPDLIEALKSHGIKQI